MEETQSYGFLHNLMFLVAYLNSLPLLDFQWDLDTWSAVVIITINIRAMAVTSLLCQALGQILTCIFFNPQNNYTDSGHYFLFTDKETEARRDLVTKVLNHLSDAKVSIFSTVPGFLSSLSNSLGLNPIGDTC